MVRFSRSPRFACLALLLALFACGCGSRSQEPVNTDIPEPNPLPEKPAAKEVVGKDSGTGKPEDPQTITFMGSRGSGRRFCIIADHSMSLTPVSLGQIKKEISTTLHSLGGETRFFLIFFAKTALPMPADNWRHGPAEVEKTEKWMESVDRSLGTLPIPAFQKAMALKPPPDVIFLMTDGLLLGKDPAGGIAALNRGETKAVIQTILFTRKGNVVPPGNAARQLLEKIASEAGGTFHQYVADPEDIPAKKKKK